MNGIIGLVISGFGLLTNVVGLAIPYWANLADVAHLGLWQSCGNVGGMDICVEIPSALLDSKFQAVRAMELMGMIGMVVAIVCVLLKMINMRENAILPKVAGVVAILAGILMICGCAIFATLDSGPLKLHAGFALCIIAGVVSIVAGVCNCINK